MAFFVDLVSADVDMTTIVSGVLTLTIRSGGTIKVWTLGPVGGATKGFATLKHDFVAGDTDTIGTYRLALSLTTSAGGVVPLRVLDLIEITN